MKSSDYDLRRMLLGVPEGPQEIIPGSALPLESCMDVNNGGKFPDPCWISDIKFLHSRLPERLLRRTRVDRPHISYGEHEKTNHANSFPTVIVVLRCECLAASGSHEVVLFARRNACTRSGSTNKLPPASNVCKPKAKSCGQSPVGASRIRGRPRYGPTRTGGTGVGNISVRRGAENAREGWRARQACCWERCGKRTVAGVGWSWSGLVSTRRGGAAVHYNDARVTRLYTSKDPKDYTVTNPPELYDGVCARLSSIRCRQRLA